MTKFLTTLSLAVCLLAPATSGAAVLPALHPTQQAQIKLLPQTGSGKARGKSSVRIDAYLSTRYADSTAPTRQGNPVGKVVMRFPAGSTSHPELTGKKVCDQNPYQGASVMARCSASLIGEGWALVNTGQYLGVGGTPMARPQLQGAPDACPAEDGDPASWSQYAATWPSGSLSCVPQGHLWNKVRVYMGALMPGAKKADAHAVIFVSENIVSVVSFPGSVSGNVLTVSLPALYGSGSYPGELFFGWVLSDFRVVINTKNFLKTGACVRGSMPVNTAITYSQRKSEDGMSWDSAQGKNILNPSNGEDIRPAPAGHAVTTRNACV